jgi:hypothetical protein
MICFFSEIIRPQGFFQGKVRLKIFEWGMVENYLGMLNGRVVHWVVLYGVGKYLAILATSLLIV